MIVCGIVIIDLTEDIKFIGNNSRIQLLKAICDTKYYDRVMIRTK